MEIGSDGLVYIGVKADVNGAQPEVGLADKLMTEAGGTTTLREYVPEHPSELVTVSETL